MKIKGYRPCGARWAFMKDTYDTCIKMDLDVPESVLEFFGFEEPTEHNLIEVDLDGSLNNFVTFEGNYGIEIDVKSLPAEVDKIRIYS